MLRAVARRFSSSTFNDIKHLNPGVGFKGVPGLGRNRILVPFDKSSHQVIMDNNRKNEALLERMAIKDSIVTPLAGYSIIASTIFTPFALTCPNTLFTPLTAVSLATFGYCSKMTFDMFDVVERCKKELKENDKTLSTVPNATACTKFLPEDWRVGKLENIDDYDWYIMNVPSHIGTNFGGINLVQL